MITEEFTFPIITAKNVVHLTVLPPIWRISPIDHSSAQNGISKRRACRSFSEVEGQIMETDEKAEAEEKMDMLWEDFNEELRKSGCSNSETLRQSCNDNDDNNNNHDNRNNNQSREVLGAQEDRGHDLIVPCGSLSAPRKKKNMKFVVGMLKKIFLVQNMVRIKKRGHN